LGESSVGNIWYFIFTYSSTHKIKFLQMLKFKVFKYELSVPWACVIGDHL